MSEVAGLPNNSYKPITYLLYLANKNMFKLNQYGVGSRSAL